MNSMRALREQNNFLDKEDYSPGLTIQRTRCNKCGARLIEHDYDIKTHTRTCPNYGSPRDQMQRVKKIRNKKMKRIKDEN